MLLSPEPKAPLPSPPLHAGEGAFSPTFEAREQRSPGTLWARGPKRWRGGGVGAEEGAFMPVLRGNETAPSFRYVGQGDETAPPFRYGIGP